MTAKKMLVAWIVLCLAGPLSAQNPAEADGNDLKTLTGKAGLVFTGVVSGIAYETNRETGHVYTIVTFRQVRAIKDVTGTFKEGSDQKLTIRQYGGLREDGKFFQKIGTPDFQLGNMYLVFFTGGPWALSPVVSWDRGYFRIVHSRTLGDSILLDHNGNVVVDIRGPIESYPLKLDQPLPGKRGLRPGREAGARQNREIQSARRKPGQDIYTEEGVQRLLEDEAGPKTQREDAQPRPSLRMKALQSLPKPPVTLTSFIQAVQEADKAYSSTFSEQYRRVYFEPKPLPAKLRDGRLEEKK